MHTMTTIDASITKLNIISLLGMPCIDEVLTSFYVDEPHLMKTNSYPMTSTMEHVVVISLDYPPLKKISMEGTSGP
jgi:hypothetical protein